VLQRVTPCLLVTEPLSRDDWSQLLRYQQATGFLDSISEGLSLTPHAAAAVGNTETDQDRGESTLTSTVNRTTRR
jgi:hypothetical protein